MANGLEPDWAYILAVYDNGLDPQEQHLVKVVLKQISVLMPDGALSIFIHTSLTIGFERY